MNSLILYNSTQTYTNTVYEHLNSFSQYSKFNYYFCHHNEDTPFHIKLSFFDAIIMHYSIRLPFNQLHETAVTSIKNFQGKKILFIQDEYDYTKRTWYWIKKLEFHLVFTVVPPAGIPRIYPQEEFPTVKFVSNFTGYVPENLDFSQESIPPSQRALTIGYRGRPLPLRYGQLGFEKINIGKQVASYCEKHSISHNIAWTESARIYGYQWYNFIKSCKAMLGSESGSNVFDWDGDLMKRLSYEKKRNPKISNSDLYEKVIRPLEIPKLMNQISPRIFECIACKTVLVLFEGEYSGIIQPDIHYVTLKKDGSNLDEVMKKLSDPLFVDTIAERAYKDIIESGNYSYHKFIKMVDHHITNSSDVRAVSSDISLNECRSLQPSHLTTYPIRMALKKPSHKLWRVLIPIWAIFPSSLRAHIKMPLKALLRFF